MTAEEAYKAGQQDTELAVQRAALAAWGSGRDCTQAEYEQLAKEEFARIMQERIARGDFATLDSTKAE